MKTCDLCGADLPALVDTCPACGRTWRARKSEEAPADAGHSSLDFAFDQPDASPSESHPSLEFAFSPAQAPSPSRKKAFDPFDVGPTTRFTGTQGSPAGDFASLTGKTIAGRFLIEELIGEGGMGQVYKARHIQLNRTVCVKVLRPGLQSESTVLKRFEREVKSASRLHHPNSIQVLDFGVDQGSMYFAMEYVEGKTLREVLRDEFPLSEERICRIVSQVLSALAEAHAAQIVHRDLKPDNIMVTQLRESPDFVKVLDFGIAKILESDDNVTAADMLCGTPQYMSPEQAAGRSYDARADLYSIGVILYQLVTGDVPFNGRNPLEVLSKAQTQAPMPLHEKRPGARVSPQFASLVMRALSKNPDGRPQTAEVFRRELLALAERARLAAEPSVVVGTPAKGIPPAASMNTVVSPAPQLTQMITMALPYAAEHAPPPPLEPTAPQSRRGSAPLPRVGDALSFELAATPSKGPRRERPLSTPVRASSQDGRWMRRWIGITVLLIALGVGARVLWSELGLGEQFKTLTAPETALSGETEVE